MTTFADDARTYFAGLEEDSEGMQIIEGLIAERDAAMDGQEALAAERAGLLGQLTLAKDVAWRAHDDCKRRYGANSPRGSTIEWEGRARGLLEAITIVEPPPATSAPKRAATLWSFATMPGGGAIAAHQDAPPCVLTIAGKNGIVATPLTAANSRPVTARFGPAILVDPDEKYPEGTE